MDTDRIAGGVLKAGNSILELALDLSPLPSASSLSSPVALLMISLIEPLVSFSPRAEEIKTAHALHTFYHSCQLG
jgi:hypothetical protein